MELFETVACRTHAQFIAAQFILFEKQKTLRWSRDESRPLIAGNFASVLDGGDADCLGTLGTLGDLELNALVLVE